MTRPLSSAVCPTPDIWPEAIEAYQRRARRRGRPARPVTTEEAFVNEEKLRVLKMLEDGKITAEEATKLLDALDKTESRPSERELKRRWIHIKVEKDGEKTTDIRLPLALLKFGFKLAPHAARRHLARAHARAERSRQAGERAQERADKIRERLERKLKEKFGPDFQGTGDVNEIVSDALNDARESMDEALAGGLGAFANGDIDLDKILEMAQSEDFDGKILDVYDDDGDEHVTIKLE
jgi:hypothetical protein